MEWPSRGHLARGRRSLVASIASPLSCRLDGTRRRTLPSSTSCVELGFVEGENLLIVPGGFLTTNEQVAEVVPAMIKAAPDVIVVGGDPISRAFQKATQSIPLLVMTEDMVGAGFAASLARPGGNITGISLMSPELDGKRQDILIEAVPAAHRIAALANPTFRRSSISRDWRTLRGRTDGSWWWFVLPAPTTSLLR